MVCTERVVRIHRGVLVDVVDPAVRWIIESLPLERVEEVMSDDGINDVELGENSVNEGGDEDCVASTHVVSGTVVAKDGFERAKVK